MATKTNTKTTKQKIFASNRPFISRVTIDGMIIGALGLIMAWASVTKEEAQKLYKLLYKFLEGSGYEV